MCRNIRTLHNFEPPATPEEIRSAAVQYVRKVSGYSKPSHANEAVFETAVEEVAQATQKLLASLVTTAPPRDREVVAARARERAAARFVLAAASMPCFPRRYCRYGPGSIGPPATSSIVSAGVNLRPSEYRFSR